MAGSIGSINWRRLKSIDVSCDEETFMRAIEIWLLKPHVVNRRLAGAVVVHRSRAVETVHLNDFIKESLKTRSDSLSKTIKTVKSQNLHSLEERCQDPNGSNSTSSTCSSDRTRSMDCSQCSESHSGFDLCLRKLIPRTLEQSQGGTEEKLLELIVTDFKKNTATFIPLKSNKLPTGESGACLDGAHSSYRFSLSSEPTRVSLHISEDYQEPKFPSRAVACPTTAWLQDCLLPKIAKWAAEVNMDKPVKNSQALISVERYSALYRELKKKYGEKFVKIWPENTDPLKFVYEDVAIATYLIVYWEQERIEMGLDTLQSFVDLGCGNGLLVHILNNEGYPGKGIDLRKRKIWDLYGPETNLEECSITPSDDFLFPDSDWLIGNHSDELTPWIPVMAARSSYSTRYFVLPCCFHDFDAKFMRSGQTKTQYRAYLDFIAEVGKVCGFRVMEDSMRIPSTKRICQIGSQRDYQQERVGEINERITKYIATRRTLKPEASNTAVKMSGEFAPEHSSSEVHGLNLPGTSTIPSMKSGMGHDDQSTTASDRSVSHDRWAPCFQPRERIEPIRNCVRLDLHLKQLIINKVADSILEQEGVNTRSTSKGTKEAKLWRRGGSLTFAQIAKLFDSKTLKQLKKECGGLKTLLKNAHQVFQVFSDRVEIRDWSVLTAPQQPRKKPVGNRSRSQKTRMCWFYTNHPDGCPRLASQCKFAHGKTELQNLSLPTG